MLIGETRFFVGLCCVLAHTFRISSNHNTHLPSVRKHICWVCVSRVALSGVSCFESALSHFFQFGWKIADCRLQISDWRFHSRIVETVLIDRLVSQFVCYQWSLNTLLAPGAIDSLWLASILVAVAAERALRLFRIFVTIHFYTARFDALAPRNWFPDPGFAKYCRYRGVRSSPLCHQKKKK